MTEKCNYMRGILKEVFFVKSQNRKFAEIYEIGTHNNGKLFCVVKNGEIVDHNFDLKTLIESVQQQIEDEDEEKIENKDNHE